MDHFREMMQAVSTSSASRYISYVTTWQDCGWWWFSHWRHKYHLFVQHWELWFWHPSCADLHTLAGTKFSVCLLFLCVCALVRSKFHLDVEQPCLQVGHSLLSQGQVPDHHIQGPVSEETLVYCGHAGLTTDVPHVECHRVLLWVGRQELIQLQKRGWTENKWWVRNKPTVQGDRVFWKYWEDIIKDPSLSV